jgi:hypothetical protein
MYLGTLLFDVTNPVSFKLKNIVDGKNSKGWPSVISLAKKTFELPPQQTDPDTPHVFQLLETASALFKGTTDNMRFNISVAAFCIAAAKLVCPIQHADSPPHLRLYREFSVFLRKEITTRLLLGYCW